MQAFRDCACPDCTLLQQPTPLPWAGPPWTTQKDSQRQQTAAGDCVCIFRHLILCHYFRGNRCSTDSLNCKEAILFYRKPASVHQCLVRGHSMRCHFASFPQSLYITLVGWRKTELKPKSPSGPCNFYFNLDPLHTHLVYSLFLQIHT